MKKLKFLPTILLACLILTCSNEKSLESSSIEIQDPNFRVSENNLNGQFHETSDIEPCITTNLIAGQNNIAGTVSVYNDGENLIITYVTNEDWSIDLTHLSIGDCDESIPTNGSGNPIIGHFEHTEPHSAGTSEVVYLIALDALEEYFCFAAHAEVTGPTGGETAWAEGTEFEGNSWAMFVEAQLSNCQAEDTDDGVY